MTTRPTDPRSVRRPRARCAPAGTEYDYYRLDAVGDRIDLAALPVTVKILLENLLRHAGGGVVREADVETLLAWRPGVAAEAEIPFMPGARPAPGLHRRPGGRRPGGHARRDGRPRWRPVAGQPARAGRPRHRPFGPGRPVRHARRVRLQRRARVRPQRRALPAPALGADGVPRPARRAARDRHRPPGQPRVPGHGRRRSARTDGRPAGLPGHGRRAPTRTRRWSTAWASSATASAGSRPRRSCWASRSTSRCRTSSASASTARCPRGSTATDLVLVVTELLRAHGVVGSFVEFAGDGLATLALADRATISNMSPEFGATSTLFPIDDETLTYLRLTGRSAERLDAGRAVRQGRRGCGASPATARPSTSCSSSTWRASSRPWPGRAGRRTGCR